MKIFEKILNILAELGTLVCAILHYATGEYTQACFWMLWIIVFLIINATKK